MQPGKPAAPPPGSDPVREIYDRLRAGLERKSYEHWIDGKISLSVVEDELTVGVGSPFLLAWMQRQFAAAFRQAARDVLGASACVCFAVDGRVGLPQARSAAPSAPSTPKSNGCPVVPAPVLSTVHAAAAPQAESRRYADLADFVDGSGSRFAYAATIRLCESSATFSGPLYIYGGVGLGKTHLLEGITRRLRADGRIRQAAFFTAETFANFFTESLRNRTLPAFRNRFRNVDALIIDDVDFFDGKRGLQEELLHTVQHLESHRRVMVFAADRHPKMLTRTSEELVTRYLSGTVTRIEPPDFETRLQILRKRADRLPEPPGAAVLEWIARRFRGGIRELEGALNCVEVYRDLSGRPVSVGTARQVLSELERDCLRAIRLPDVEKVVCEFFGVEPDVLRSAKRSRSISQPRMLAMFLARKHTRSAYGEIGAHFGGRNHSTVIAAERKVRQLVEAATMWQVASEAVAVADVVRSLESRLRTA